MKYLCDSIFVLFSSRHFPLIRIVCAHLHATCLFTFLRTQVTRNPSASHRLNTKTYSLLTLSHYHNGMRKWDDTKRHRFNQNLPVPKVSSKCDCTFGSAAARRYIYETLDWLKRSMQWHFLRLVTLNDPTPSLLHQFYRIKFYRRFIWFLAMHFVCCGWRTYWEMVAGTISARSDRIVLLKIGVKANRNEDDTKTGDFIWSLDHHFPLCVAHHMKFEISATRLKTVSDRSVYKMNDLFAIQTDL